MSKQKLISKTDVPLVTRRVRFDWSETPLEWIPGQPYASHFINNINMLLPAGEFWFCRVYNQALPLIRDAKLREDVQGFVRQEAMHARAHGAAVAEYLAAHNVETDGFMKQVDWLFEELLGDKPLGLTVPRFMSRDWLVFRLGIIATVEHFTCVLGKYVLDTRSWDQSGADPTLLDLLRWHGAEEIEHRSVAFDLYRHLGGRYPTRYLLSLIVVPMLFGLWAHGAAHLMRQDPKLQAHKPSVLRPWLWLEWQRTARKGQLPSLPWLVWQGTRYFSPRYNPVHEASTAQAQAYLQGSPAARLAAAA